MKFGENPRDIEEMIQSDLGGMEALRGCSNVWSTVGITCGERGNVRWNEVMRKFDDEIKECLEGTEFSRK